MENKLPKWLQSSVNPEKLSLTIKALASLLLFVAPLIGLSVTQTDVDNLIPAIVGGLSALGTAISSVGVIWGIIRKFLPKKPQ